MASQDLGFGITAIDTGFQRPSFDASHLLVENGRAAFVDVGTTYSAPRLLAVLEEMDIARDAVDYVVLTHVHLDHAGGAGAMMRALPAARLIVHPRGARHVVDPSVLWAGASAVFGEDVMNRHYGEPLPVEASRVIEAGEGYRFELAGRPLRCLDTPGHARHHICLWDQASRGVFTGDTFGLAYPELASERGPFLLPTTTPVQFEPEALHASIDRLLALEPEAAYLTHYSRVSGLPSLAADLRRRVDEQVALARSLAGSAERSVRLREGLLAMFERWTREHGTPGAPERIRELLQIDVELNAQGLEVWLDRERR